MWFAFTASRGQSLPIDAPASALSGNEAGLRSYTDHNWGLGAGGMDRRLSCCPALGKHVSSSDSPACLLIPSSPKLPALRFFLMDAL